MGAGRGQTRRSQSAQPPLTPSVGDQCIFQRPSNIDAVFIDAYHNQVFQVLSAEPEEDKYVVALVGEDGSVYHDDSLTVRSRHLVQVPTLSLA